MIEYIKHNNYSSYLKIDQDRFLLHRVHINALKQISFHLNDWLQFLDMLKSKTEVLLRIAENVIGEKRSNQLEMIIWTLLEMASEVKHNLVKEYLEYHAHLCFSKIWIHRYTYFEYHGFNMKKDRSNYLRNKFDKGINSFPSHIQYQISNVIDFGINDKSQSLRIAPLSKYAARININNTGWKNLTVDAHSLNLQTNVTQTQKLIAKIANQLNKKGSLSNIADEFNISTSIVVMYAFAAHPYLMVSLLKRSFRSQMLNNSHISLSGALQVHLEQDSNLLTKLKAHVPEIYQLLMDLTMKYQTLQVVHYKIFNKRLDSLKLKEYHLGYVLNKKWRRFKVDLNTTFTDTVAKDIRRYTLYRASNNKEVSSSLIRFFSFIKNKNNTFNIDAADINIDDLILWLASMEQKIGFQSARTPITSFYKYLINIKTINNEKNVEKIKSIYKLISSEINIKNQEVHNPTTPMPEDVYLQIRVHLNEINLEIKNAFMLQTATGCRPSELASLHKDSLKYDKKLNCYVLSIFASKQEASYGKQGKLPIRKVPIYDEEVIQSFHEQVKISQKIRKESGIDSIFIRRYKRRHVVKYHIPSSKELIREINILINNHNIKSDLDDDIWHYTPYQMRAMIATTMVEKGHAPEEIKAFFGWLSSQTSEKAYAFIRKKKTEELNTEFFQKHFKVSFNEDLLSSYSREEKEQIFVKLYMHKRKMEYGECVRHPIMGECGKLQSPESCASCARLITDTVYLNNWIKIRDNQQEIFDAMIESLELEGYTEIEYKHWAEYIIQKQRLDSYQSHIDRLSSKKGS